MTTDNSIAADCGLRAADRGSGKRHFTERASRFALFRFLDRIEHGSLTVTFPDGEQRFFRGDDRSAPAAELRIRDSLAIERLIRAGDLGFAESYLDGQWDTSNLLDLMEVTIRNEKVIKNVMAGGALSRILNRIYHWRRDNNRQGSRRNIAYHYDLGNAFYRLWLDDGMTYSSALFEFPEQDLASGQAAKYHLIADLAGLSKGAKVLEIGCGWGGFMEYAARNRGCTVDGVTLSKEQLDYANQRMALAGLGDRAAASLTDYRDTSGEYDAVVSIEMLEAVGEAHWPRYFETLYRRLKPGAGAVVQAITVADDRFGDYRGNPDFIQRHVFPGGMLPSPSILREQGARAGFTLEREQTFGSSYARTLALWHERFIAAWPQIARQGFDERFRRLWQYYLCYCETGFRAGTIDVGIYRFRKPL